MNYKLIFEGLFGSHLYGTSTPESDLDLRGVCIPFKQYLLSPFKNFEQQEFPGEDKVHFALKKFFQLAVDCNPNIVELFFVPQDKSYVWTGDWEFILNNRDKFFSQKARFTFAGYATAQLKRIKLHRSWLLSPPKEEPTRKKYELPDAPYFGMEKTENLIHGPIECIEEAWRDYALREKAYHDARAYWNNYQNWKQTRNPKRAVIEEKFGYDTKHGMHLYRLLTEAEELLTYGRITLPRPDAEFLLQIRNGHFSYEELIEIGDNFQNRIDSMDTNLPKKPNLEEIENVYLTLLGE